MSKTIVIIQSILFCFLFGIIAITPASAEEDEDSYVAGTFETQDYIAQYNKRGQYPLTGIIKGLRVINIIQR